MSSSEVWNYFDKKNKNEAICRIPGCKAVIKLVNYGTSSLKNHISGHGIQISSKRKLLSLLPESSKIQKIESSMTTFVKRESREFLLSKCAAKDGFAVSKIIKSDACKAYLSSRQFQMPSSCSTVWEDVKKYYDQQFECFKQDISDWKRKGFKFSIMIDEWTDNSLRRYLNINIHNGLNSLQFCLASIGTGKCDAYKLKEVVLKKMQSIGLDIKSDIVASTHDGASVMKKYGTLMPFEKQLCINHGINLAILDVFYKKPIIETPSDEEHSDCEDIELEDTDDAWCIDEPEPLSMNVSFEHVINTVRKYFKTFKKSPVKLAQLRHNVKQVLGKELTIKFDCKTRWNSVLPMLVRFDEIKSIIKSTMSEYNLEYDENIDEKISEIIACLSPVEDSIKKLSYGTCDILVAEATSIYLLASLQKLNNSTSIQLFEAMKTRIDERRNVDLVSVLLFLHSGEYPKDNIYFKYLTKLAIRKKIKEIYLKLFGQEQNEEYEESSSDNKEVSTLDEAITSFMSVKPIRLGIENDIKGFEGTKERTERLDMIFNALKTIQATSTAVERTFSVAGNFKTKIRSRLHENKLNMLVFLKYHFQNLK